MAGASIEASIDDKQVMGALTRLRALAADPAPMMRAIGTGLVEVTRRRFETATDPWGRPWRPLLPAYAAMKRGPGILREAGMSGGLMGSLTFTTAGNTVTIGTNKVYGAVHQFGATIRPKHAKALFFVLAGSNTGARFGVHVRSVTIPARPYLGFGIADLEVIEDVAETFLQGALHG